MNKIASMYYLQKQNIPTLDFWIIKKEKIEDVQDYFYKTRFGWVIRCGRHPSIDDKPEKGLPWHVCSSLDEMIETIRNFYKDLREEYHVFIHPQREMIKSGNILILGDKCIIEAVRGWPEGLSHGKEQPEASYEFRTPSLFVEPSKIKGDEDLIKPEELFRIGKNIERRLNYAELSLTKPINVEFSFNRYGNVSAHDIQIY